MVVFGQRETRQRDQSADIVLRIRLRINKMRARRLCSSFAMDSLSAMYCTSSFGLVRLVNSWQKQDLKFPVCSPKKERIETPKYAHATLVKEEKKGGFQKRIRALAHALGGIVHMLPYPVREEKTPKMIRERKKFVLVKFPITASLRWFVAEADCVYLRVERK